MTFVCVGRSVFFFAAEPKKYTFFEWHFVFLLICRRQVFHLIFCGLLLGDICAIAHMVCTVYVIEQRKYEFRHRNSFQVAPPQFSFTFIHTPNASP